MPKIRGAHVVAGVGGGFLSLDNRALEPGADPGFLDDRYFAAATDRGIVKFDAFGVEPPLPLHPWRPNRLLVGGGVWAAHMNTAPDGSHPGMFTSRSATTSSTLYPLAVGPDGAIAYKVYSAEWGAYLIPADGSSPESLTTDTVLDLQLLGGKRAIWTNPAFQLKVAGLTQPVQVGPARRPLALEIQGVWHVLYWVHPNGPVVLHPFDSLDGWIVHEGDAWGYDATVIPDVGAIQFAYGAKGEGEQPGEIAVETFVLGINQRVNLPAVLKPPTEPIVPFNGKLWFGWFEKGSTRSPAPHNCEVTREDEVVRTDSGLSLAQYLAVEDKGNTPEAYEEAIAAARRRNPALPVIAYWPRSAQSRAYVPRCDWVGVEGYAVNDEPILDVERRLDAVMGRCSRAALIAKGYNNPDQTVDLAALVPMYSRVMDRYRDRLAGVFIFSNTGRVGGLPDHPEIRPLWEELFRSITGAPPVVVITPKPPVTPEPPTIPEPPIHPDPPEEPDMPKPPEAPDFNQWIKVDFPKVRAAYVQKQGHAPNDEWAAFQTMRYFDRWIHFPNGEYWPIERMIAEEANPGSTSNGDWPQP